MKLGTFTAKSSKTSNAILGCTVSPHSCLSRVSPYFASDRPCPDPVKLIRRICALERSIVDLTADCEQIAQHRSDIAPEVIATQQENIAMIREVSLSVGWLV